MIAKVCCVMDEGKENLALGLLCPQGFVCEGHLSTVEISQGAVYQNQP